MYDMLVLFAASRFRSLSHDEDIASRLAEFFAKVEKPEDVLPTETEKIGDAVSAWRYVDVKVTLLFDVDQVIRAQTDGPV